MMAEPTSALAGLTVQRTTELPVKEKEFSEYRDKSQPHWLRGAKCKLSTKNKRYFQKRIAKRRFHAGR